MLKSGFLRPCRSDACALALVFSGSSAFAAADVLSWHNNNARTGANTSETILAPANVNATNFGKLFSISVDGKVDAQPLVVTSLAINGRAHDVVYVVTEHDTVYACDAHDGTLVWPVPRSLLKTGETPSDSRGCKSGHA